MRINLCTYKLTCLRINLCTKKPTYLRINLCTKKLTCLRINLESNFEKDSVPIISLRSFPRALIRWTSPFSRHSLIYKIRISVYPFSTILERFYFKIVLDKGIAGVSHTHSKGLIKNSCNNISWTHPARYSAQISGDIPELARGLAKNIPWFAFITDCPSELGILNS